MRRRGGGETPNSKKDLHQNGVPLISVNYWTDALLGFVCRKRQMHQHARGLCRKRAKVARETDAQDLQTSARAKLSGRLRRIVPSKRVQNDRVAYSLKLLPTFNRFFLLPISVGPGHKHTKL